MKQKPKKCRSCKSAFFPSNSLQIVCGPKCAIEHAKKTRKKQESEKLKEDRKKLRKRKEDLKTKSQWAKEAQSAFNGYIRMRDTGRPCISCGRHHTGQYHAGHYRTTASAPQLRFNTYNVSLQCAPCNSHLSGNIGLYREALIARYDIERVEWLENNNGPAGHTVEYYKRVKTIFRRRARHIAKLRGYEL